MGIAINNKPDNIEKDIEIINKDIDNRTAYWLFELFKILHEIYQNYWLPHTGLSKWLLSSIREVK